ncbi:hypothetical protein DFH07DRAFT_855393 [Mycena maculata]|uniref:Uncharacterized protein n=1 Tax=Mycena maculata TaxID=230809 RepID=A0AAD7MM75_9AGAR|nr:hypothetical protein DFH07DRAFT_855393 [Mycena maculata]
MAPTIKELVQDAFGPYPDYLILNPGWCPKGTKLPQLRRLILEQDGQWIGLDTSERWVVAPTQTASFSPVFFYGVLLIEKLAWLSEAGKIFLTEELNERDTNWGQRTTQNSRKSSQFRSLKLTGLYPPAPAPGTNKIKVWIRCEKHSPAMFMTETTYPRSLLLNSKDRKRSYEILTIDRAVYDLCRNFLERYRLVGLIKEIMGNPDYHLEPNSAEVDVLVDGYLNKHKHEALSHAVIFADHDKPPTTKLRLRHVSHAEVRSHFAKHSGWLLALYLSGPRKDCPIDVRAWCEFISKVRVAKMAPKPPPSQNWGQTYDDDELWASDTDGSNAAIAKTLQKFGGTAAKWEHKLARRMRKESPPPRERRAKRTRDDDDDEPVIYYPPTFDSDFSEPSTPGCSDSEYDSDVPSVPLPGILSHMYNPPTLRPGRFIWDCPISNCTHSIDLLNLRPQDTADLPSYASYTAVYVKEKQYGSLADEQVQWLLCHLVSLHYWRHLRIEPNRQKKEFITELAKRWTANSVVGSRD